MKLVNTIALGAVALVATVPFVSQIPFGQRTGVAIAQTSPSSLQLRLTAEKLIVQQSKTGNKQSVWLPLQGNITVLPGEILRYTISGNNTSDRPIKNLVLTQPVPKQTVYVLSSATTGNNVLANITYSIDNGKNFVVKPTIKVKLTNGKIETQPAPASAYTHIRWQFNQLVSPKSSVSGIYQLKVR